MKKGVRGILGDRAPPDHQEGVEQWGTQEAVAHQDPRGIAGILVLKDYVWMDQKEDEVSQDNLEDQGAKVLQVLQGLLGQDKKVIRVTLGL